MVAVKKSGETILGYRIAEKIGEGGMGSVYRAMHGTLGQEVAIKILDPTLARNAEVRARFIQEAKIQFTLRHPSIVQVITADDSPGCLCLVMEYVAGLPLDQVIAKRGSLPIDEALGIFRQVLEGVAYAHENGIVHRDLKPANIILKANGSAKITDFGIARVAGNAKMTRVGSTMGSASYMSPEQILGARDIDYRTDIYSLGVTLFEMLTGEIPFVVDEDEETDSDFKIRQAHVNDEPRRLRDVLPDCPLWLDEVVARSLAKKREERFRGVSDLMDSISSQTVSPNRDPDDSPVEGLPGHKVDQSQLTKWYSPSWILVAIVYGSGLLFWLLLLIGLAVSSSDPAKKKSGWTPEDAKRLQELRAMEQE